MLSIIKNNSSTLKKLSIKHLAYYLAKREKPINGELFYHRSIVKKCERAIDEYHSPKIKLFFETLLKNNYNLLTKILIGEPSTLHKIDNEIKRKIRNKVYPMLNSWHNNKSITFRGILNKVFNYTGFLESKDDEWGAYEFSRKLNINVCSYCNRSYTFTYEKVKGLKRGTRPEFDHFYSQFSSPWLAISLYNLIPSCHICNSSLKHDEEFSITNNINPYLNDYEEDAYFTVNLLSKKVLNKNREISKDQIEEVFGIGIFNGHYDGFEIQINPKHGLKNATKKRINNNLRVFRIQDLYNGHKDIVVDMLKKSLMYNDTKIDELFNEYGSTLFSSKEEVLSLILGNYINSNDFNKRVLSKFMRDIAIDFKIY